MLTDEEVEQRRREKLIEINQAAAERAALEARHGTVWDTAEIQVEFEALAFAAPLLIVRRRSDGVRGSVWFQHAPRFYWGFQPDDSA